MNLNNSDKKDEFGILTKWRESFYRHQDYTGFTPTHIKSTRKVIDPFVFFIKDDAEISLLEDIKKYHILKHLEEKGLSSIGRKYEPSTTNQYIKIIRTFFTYIEDENTEEHIFTRLFKKIKVKEPKKPIDYLTVDQQKILEDYIYEDMMRGGHYAFVKSLGMKLTRETGVRTEEFLNIKLSDINSFDEELYKIRIVAAKGGSVRFIYIHKELIDYELDYFKKLGNDYIFTSKKGKLIHRSSAYSMINKVYLKLGMSKAGFHRLRRTKGMNHYREFRDIVSTSRTLGHTSLTHTMRYANAEDFDIINQLKGKR